MYLIPSVGYASRSPIFFSVAAPLDAAPASPFSSLPASRHFRHGADFHPRASLRNLEVGCNS